MLENDINNRVSNIERRVDEIERVYGQKIAVIEEAIDGLQVGVKEINKSLDDIKTILTKHVVAVEYMNDIFVTKSELGDTIRSMNEQIVQLKARLDATEQVSEGFWEKYGYIISTIAVLVSILALFLRGG